MGVRVHVFERLSSIISGVKEMASIDSSVAEIQSILESAHPLIEDAAVSLRKQKDKYETEPGELSVIEERCSNSLKSLRRNTVRESSR